MNRLREFCVLNGFRFHIEGGSQVGGERWNVLITLPHGVTCVGSGQSELLDHAISEAIRMAAIRMAAKELAKELAKKGGAA